MDMNTCVVCGKEYAAGNAESVRGNGSCRYLGEGSVVGFDAVQDD